MPVAALKPNHKISPWFMRPLSNNVRIYVESTQSVDVYISSSQQVGLITSVEVARQLGILVYPGIKFLDQNVTLSNFWDAGWNLTIGYAALPTADVAAVYYAVFNL